MILHLSQVHLTDSLHILQSAEGIKLEPHILQEFLLNISRVSKTAAIRIMSIDPMESY
jgi:hypothetical protein